MRDSRVLGALVVGRKSPGEFPKETVDLLQTFSSQSVLAIQNARLFRDITEQRKRTRKSLIKDLKELSIN